MSYEFNPLLRDELQKKSPVTPSDIQQLQAAISELQESSENLNQKKVTKFFSANDVLQPGEIAEYQGETDTDNNLIPGYFYKKNPDITINKTSATQSLSMRDWFGYDFLNNLIVSHKFTADRTLPEKVFFSGNFDNSDYETVGLFLIAANTTNIFDTKWSILPDNRRLAPFVFFVENNIVVARYANVVYDGSKFFIDGQRFFLKNQTTGNYSHISYNPDNNCFYYWNYCTLGTIPFYFPVAIASSDYSTADLIFTNSLPIIASRLQFVQPAVLITYYTYTASINTALFQRVNTQSALIWSAYDSTDSEPRFINIDSLSGLENIKFSYNARNDYYITYDNLIARPGSPDIKYLDYVTINSLGAIYTHGQFLLANKTVDDYQYNGSVYGVQWDTSDPSPEVTRIGNLSLHATLPVHTKIVGGVMTDDGNFTPFANQSDWTNETRDGSLGQVMVKIPEFWIKFITEGTIYKVLMSDVPVLGFLKTSDLFGSAYEASLDRENLKLASVVNNSVNYRGGNNTSSWDGTYRTLLGRPVTNINLTNFRTYARNRNSINGEPDTRWNCNLYELHRLLYWLYVVEYATLNTQKPYNAELTSEGFRKGGLGNGVSEWSDSAWSNFNNYNPFVPCGFTDDLGNQTGIKTYNVVDSNNNILYAASVPRYRGIELPFSHIWKWTDGLLVEVAAFGNSAVFTTDDCSKFSSTDISNYNFIGNQVRSENFIKGIIFGNHGDIIANQFAGNSATYYCDYYYGSNIPSSDVSLRGCRFGGQALNGAQCGLVYGNANRVPDDAHASIGSRLCFKA